MDNQTKTWLEIQCEEYEYQKSIEINFSATDQSMAFPLGGVN